MEYFVYVLKSLSKGFFYKGLAENLERRLEQHFEGRSATTRTMLPLKLVHVELVNSRYEARKLEKYLKSGFGRETIKEIDSSL